MVHGNPTGRLYAKLVLGLRGKDPLHRAGSHWLRAVGKPQRFRLPLASTSRTCGRCSTA